MLTPFFKAFRKDPFRLGWYLTECHPNSSEPWLEKFSQEIPANKGINNHTLARVFCVTPGFIFVRGGWHFSWPYVCLDSWETGDQCLLAHLTVPVNIHNISETYHWFSLLNLHGHLKWNLP